MKMTIAQQKLANEVLFKFFKSGEDPEIFNLLRALYLPHAFIIKNEKGGIDAYVMNASEMTIPLRYHVSKLWVMTHNGWSKIKDREVKSCAKEDNF